MGMKLIEVRQLVRNVIAEDKYHPADHMLGMRVPKGGSSCASCAWLDDDSVHCTNKFFQAWNADVVGTNEPSKLPTPADEYCCDLWTRA